MNRSIKVLVMAALAVVGVATTMVTGASSASAQEYGLDACLQGYVWREAMASDHVCVTPATRSQAWSDNAQAANRRALLNIWITRWYPTANCGEGCSISDAGVAHMKINGEETLHPLRARFIPAAALPVPASAPGPS